MAEDFRFEIVALDEPEMGCTHLVRMIETLPCRACNATGQRFDTGATCSTCGGRGSTDGDELECFTTDNPYGAVEAAREAQAFPDLEERWAMYAERGW